MHDAGAKLASIGKTLAFFAVFILLGPVIGGMLFWLTSGLVLGAVLSVTDLVKLAAGAWAISIVFAPLGMLQALIAATVSALLSRQIASRNRWVLWSGVAGGLASAFSLSTALVAYLFVRDLGAIKGGTFAVLSMLLIGAVSAAICAVLTIKLRPSPKTKTATP